MRIFRRLAILIALIIMIFTFFACDQPIEEYEPSITIKFVDDDVIIHEEALDITTLITPMAPSKNNMSFEGWYFDCDFHEAFSLDEILSHVNNDVVMVFARYTTFSETKPMVTISFMTDGIEYTKISCEKGDIFAMPADPTKDNYTFKGWYIDDTFSQIFDHMNATASGVFSDITLYGRFEENYTTLTFLVNGKKYDTTTVMLSEPTLMPTDPIMDGMTFLYWREEGHDVPFDLDTYRSLEERVDITLNAVFVKNSVTITLKDDDKLVDVLSINMGEKISNLPILDKTLTHAFDKWTLIDGSKFDLDAYNEDIFREDIVLIANYRPRKNTLNFYNGNSLISSNVVDEHLTISMPSTPTIDNGVFRYWYYIKEGNKVVFDPDTYLQDIDREDLDMYAYFDIIRATINWFVDDEIVHTDTVLEGEKITLQKAPTKPNNTFIEWQICGRTLDVTALNNDIITGKITSADIVAVFESKVTYIQFIADDYEKAHLPFDDNTTFIMPDNPTLDGYTFVGWYYDDRTYTHPFTIEEYKNCPNRQDIAVYAKFEK